MAVATTRTGFYQVDILTERGWEHSRICNTKRVAVNYAKWCSKRWAAIVWYGCSGGERIATFEKQGVAA